VVGGVGLFATAVATGGLALPIAAAVTTVALARQAKPHAPATPASPPASPSEPDEVFTPPTAPVVTPATDTPYTCSDKAASAKGTIDEQTIVVSELAGKVRLELNKHKIIKTKIESMKHDLDILRKERDNFPPPRNDDERSLRSIADKAIESCSLGMDGMETAVEALVATIEKLKEQINEFDTPDYDITSTLDLP
jgi:hypothetical protein